MTRLAKIQVGQLAVSDVGTNVPRARASSPHPGTMILIGGIIGAIYTIYLFPLDFVVGTAPFWQRPPISDLATEIAGTRYYISDAWWFQGG
jgi:hypothetical protein